MTGAAARASAHSPAVHTLAGWPPVSRDTEESGAAHGEARDSAPSTSRMRSLWVSGRRSRMERPSITLCRVTWETRATAFAWTVHQGRLLAVLHERLGPRVWEVPGGHLEDDETFEQAAGRETLEETGISVEIHDHMATCVHEWQERRQRRLIMFFRAAPVMVAQPSPGDSGIVRAEWVDLRRMRPETTSPFLHPLLARAAAGGGVANGPILFRADHRRDAAGDWRPHILPGVTAPAD